MCFFDVKFENDIMEILHITIGDVGVVTLIMFHNLLAYEQCCPCLEVTIAVMLLLWIKSITPKDVTIL